MTDAQCSDLEKALWLGFAIQILAGLAAVALKLAGYVS